MRAVEWLEFAGIEIANSARTTHYARTIGLSGLTMSADCPCEAIDEGYDTPETDPAPWYEDTRPESADFFGLYAHSIEIVSGGGRSVSPGSRHGAVLGSARYAGKQIQVVATMVARSALGMAYGQAWLKEVLRGTPCNEGDCPTDTACFLPACPEDEYDPDSFFRTLVGVGCAERPFFSRINELRSECYIQRVSFLLQSSQAYEFHPPFRCLEDDPIVPDYYDSYYGNHLSCSLTTPTWMGDGTFIIDIAAQSDLTDLRISGRVSLDGNCPVEAPATSVMPSFVYLVPEMAMDDRLVIDGRSQQALYYLASGRIPRSALSRMTFDGPFLWPDVGTCQTMCLTLEVGSGEATATVDTVLREL